LGVSFLKIREINKKEQKVEIVFEDDSVLEMDEADYLTMCLYDREELLKEEISEIIYKSQVKKAKLDAVKFISYKIKSTYEVIRRLRELNYNNDVIDAVVEALTRDNYLNDRDYAERYARTKIKLKKISKKQLELELQQKGISDEIIANLRELYAIDEHSDIERLLLKKYRGSDLKDSKLRLKAIKFLYSKGYEVELIQSVIDKVTGNSDI
jgi:regulatory protein